MRHDAVVIGSGPNGLVAANLLVDAGWDVVVIEAQPTPGGAVASDEGVREGFVHDTFSAFYPLAAASPTIKALGLERHGLEWVHAPAVCGHALGRTGWAVQHRDPVRTAAELERLCPGDGDAWLRLVKLWDHIGDDLIGALLSPFPPVRRGASLAASLPGAGGLALIRKLLQPARSLGTELFDGDGPRLLLAGNAAHADMGTDSVGSGVMGLLLVMMGQHVGYPVPRGGAGRLSGALVDRFTSRGGRLVLGTRVDEVIVQGGRAVAVRTAAGEVVRARRAVVADVTAPALYGGLVAWDHLPDRLRRRMRGFEWDPGTIKVDWALDSPIPWDPAPSVAPGTVHLADSLDELALADAQLNSGHVPRGGLVIVGQMATSDPTRAPAGAESAWAYTHVPHVVRGDAGAAQGEEHLHGEWDAAMAERMAERVERRIEAHAPGFRERILARRVLGPMELQARNENLVGGSVNGGTAALQQQLIFRPVPGLGRAETPVKGLYLGSASAHPGGGVHGACGANAARAALFHDRIRLRRS